MKRIVVVFLLSLLLAFGCHPTHEEEFSPPLVFEIWGSLPFPKDLMQDTLSQRIVWSMHDNGRSINYLTKHLNLPPDKIQKRLDTLVKYDLVKQTPGPGKEWKANFPIYDSHDIDRAEEIAKPYAEREAQLLITHWEEIKSTYEQLQIATQFTWEEMAWIIVGAAITDMAVYDRVRFLPEFFDSSYLPPVHPDGSRWLYTGYVDRSPRYLLKRETFSQSFVHDSTTGFAVFSMAKPHGERSRIGFHPIYLGIQEHGEILFNLSEGPMHPRELLKRSGLEETQFQHLVNELGSFDPPALEFMEDGRIRTRIPIINEHDFEPFFGMVDRLARLIHSEITVPYSKDLQGLYPDGQLPRDVALKILADKGYLPKLPEPPIPWSFGVWGWQGFLKLWDENLD